MHKPWLTDNVPNQVLYARGMLGVEERRAFFWMAKNWITGSGYIVDAGSFLGASTFCFAAGASARGQTSFHGRPIVQAFDYFKAMDNYVVEAIRRDFRHIDHGESYLDIFEFQTGQFNALIESHSGDFLNYEWPDEPIEILFIDLAKTQSLCSHVIGEMFPRLIPGKSIIIHQDYLHCWHPYIHVTMEYLDDYFEVVDELIEHQSRAWRLIRPIPQDEIERLKVYDLDPEVRIALLDRVIAKSRDGIRQMIEVTRLWQRVCDNDFETAAWEFRKLDDQYNFNGRAELWAQQARQMIGHIPNVKQSSEPSKKEDPVVENGGTFCIISLPRSGSNLLVELINNADGVTCHHEIFNKDVMHSAFLTIEDIGMSLEDRSTDPKKFIEKIVRESRKKFPNTKAVGFKIFAFQDDFNVGPLACVLSDNSISKVLLDRSNRLDMYSSLLIAQRTNRWYEHSRGAWEEKVHYSESDFLEFCEQQDQLLNDVRLEAIKSGGEMIVLDYEDVVNNTDKCKDIFRLLGVQAPSNVVFELKKQNSERHRDRFVNFDEVVMSLGRLGKSSWIRE